MATRASSTCISAVMGISLQRLCIRNGLHNGARYGIHFICSRHIMCSRHVMRRWAYSGTLCKAGGNCSLQVNMLGMLVNPHRLCTIPQQIVSVAFANFRVGTMVGHYQHCSRRLQVCHTHW